MVSQTLAKASSVAFHTEVAVIGAGVIGLSVARSLAMAGKEVIILDRADSIGSETSSRNSEVIHAGLYYPPKSQKAQFCVRGKHLLYDFCRSRDIAHRNTGKLIVATQADQLKNKLPTLQQQAIQNGVDDTQILSQEDVKAMEPNVQSMGALWSPSTGVVDSHSFMLNLLGDAEDHGAALALQSNVATDDDNDMYTEQATIEKSNPDGILVRVDDSWLECDAVINSAGLWAHHVARAIQKHNKHQSTAESSQHIPQQYFAKGIYFGLSECKNPFHHLVYPLPEPGGLGVHATLDWSGNGVKFGPDVEWIDPGTQHPDEIDLTPDPSNAEKFYHQIRKYWPDLPDDTLVPDYAGIRPKLHHPSLETDDAGGASFHDFMIQTPKEHGRPGLINLFGMESPGLTCSMAVGEYIANEVTSW